MRRLERRNKKCIKESNATEWRAIENQAHSEAMTHVEDRNDDSQSSLINFDLEEEFSDPKIQKIVNKYLKITKKKEDNKAREAIWVLEKGRFL